MMIFKKILNVVITLHLIISSPPPLQGCGLISRNNRITPTTPKPFNQNSVALLSGTLRTYQKVSCDEHWMTLRCPTGTTITVDLAKYGRSTKLPVLCPSVQSPASASSNLYPGLMDPNSTSCQWPASSQYGILQTVVGLCQKKASCKFQTAPRTFGGDPCPGTRKYVEVAFKCRPTEFKSVIGCEDEVIQLKCNRSSRLAIYSANYGRTEYESVQCPQPNGVSEESCLSSFATETVMQMCHGKRRCALNADPPTFGNPCKPESRMYLKVIYTCVPRKVLQEKYQGEPEPDEMFEVDEPEDDVADTAVVEQPSIYSPDHSKSWSLPKNSTSNGRHSPSPNSVSESSKDTEMIGDSEHSLSSSAVLSPRHRGLPGGNNLTSGNRYLTRTDGAGVQIIYLFSQGINAYDFMARNVDTVYLVIAIGTATALLLMVILIAVKFKLQRRRPSPGREGNSSTGLSSVVGTNKPSSSSAGPILSSGLSDLDELSVDMEQSNNEMTFTTELPSILKRASPVSPYDPGDSPCTTTTGLGTASTTLSRSNEVVRFSNTLGRRGRGDGNINVRSFKPEMEDEHFFYG